jgi:hypothetical protein
MKNYEVIYKKLDDYKKNDSGIIFKVMNKNSENIQELSKLSYEIKNPQPTTHIFS